MKLNASPRQDGLHVEFYSAGCDWIGEEVAKPVPKNQPWCFFPPLISESDIALLLKKLVQQVCTNHRHIRFCNVVYKLIATALANRLKPHLTDSVDPAHKTFTKGRRTSNSIIVSQEITHSFACN